MKYISLWGTFMFIQKYMGFKLFIFFLILSFGCGQSLSALEFEVSPFALYEQGEKDIYIDGVRTKYGLGAVGATVETNLGGGFNIGTGIGYGYHPSADLSLTVDDRSVSVTGPVAGIYLQGLVNYLFWDKSDYSLSTELSYISRNVDAPDLAGMAGSRPITGSAVNDFDTIDLVLSSQFPIGKTAFLKISGGLSQWNLKTSAVALYTQATGVLSYSGITISCPCTVTYPKEIDTTSIDPIVGISIVSRNPKHNFDLEFYNRSLKSKAETQIIGVEFEYKFNF